MNIGTNQYKDSRQFRDDSLMALSLRGGMKWGGGKRGFEKSILDGAHKKTRLHGGRPVI